MTHKRIRKPFAYVLFLHTEDDLKWLERLGPTYIAYVKIGSHCIPTYVYFKRQKKRHNAKFKVLFESNTAEGTVIQNRARLLDLSQANHHPFFEMGQIPVLQDDLDHVYREMKSGVDVSTLEKRNVHAPVMAQYGEVIRQMERMNKSLNAALPRE